MAEGPVTPGWDTPGWVTVAEAARRLSMSPSWFKAWAKEAHIVVLRRGNQPGVQWSSVEKAVARSKVLDRYQRRMDPERDLPGVGLIAAVLRKFGWSHRDLADALGVTPGTITKYLADGVTNEKIPILEALSRMDPEDAHTPRRSRDSRPRRQP